MAANSLQEVYPYPQDRNELLLNLALTLNQVIRGRANNTGTFTLTANQTTTVVTDNLFGPDSVILWTPLTANAAAALGGLYLSTRGVGSFTLTHANSAQTDRDFAYVRVG